MSNDAQAALAQVLRQQIMDRVRSQEQLLIVTAALAGAAASFGGRWLRSHSEAVAFLALLFITLALAILRQDQEITNLASHLTDEGAFGAHAAAQRAWEKHKIDAMQRSGPLRTIATYAQVIGIYGLPIGAYLASVVAALRLDPTSFTWGLACASFPLAVLFGVGAADANAKYSALDQPRPRQDQVP